MIQDTRIKFIAVLLLTAVAAYIVAPIPGKPRIPFLSEAKIHPGIDLAGGAELRYKVLFPVGFTGDKERTTQQVAEVIRRRLETKQLQEPKIHTHGNHGIVIQLPGVDADGLRDYKRLLEILGNLELYEAGPKDLQDRYLEDNMLPDGYKVVRSVDGAPLLIREQPVIEGCHILNAEDHPEMSPGGVRWFTTFELDAEGARIFDEAAGRLFHQRPQGRIAILLDGTVKSVLGVQSPSFHGRGQISGAKDQKEAKELSIILRSGSLPAPIGSE